MRQIYNVIMSHRERFVMDEKEGMVLRREQVMKPSDTVAIKSGEVEYTVRPDGTFVVPDAVADHFLRQPGWNEGANPFVTGAEPEGLPKVRKVAAKA